MKKILALMLLVLTLTACGKDAEENTSPAPETEKPDMVEVIAPQKPKPKPEVPAEPVPEEPVEQPAEEPAPEPAPVPAPAPAVEKLYYVKINCQANTVTIYTKDEAGNYTVPYMSMICSTGTATPQTGVYRIGYKWEWLGLFGDVFGYYVTQITGNILFHSVPYLEKYNPASLEYWEFDKLGTAASMGCIRLQVKDSKWIYQNAEKIYRVEFYNAEDPGPLGRPTAPLISDNEQCRNWDPTDPNPANPWHTYQPEVVEPAPEEVPPVEEPAVMPEEGEIADAVPDAEGAAEEQPAVSEEPAEEVLPPAAEEVA